VSLAADKPTHPTIRLTGMIWAIAALGVVGLGIILGGTIGLAAVGVRLPEILGPLAIVGSLSLFGICALLIRLVSRLAHLPAQPDVVSPVRRRPPLKEHAPQQIGAPPDMYSSVTEHTTHVFDPTQRKDTQP
jgi:hypothetical protein